MDTDADPDWQVRQRSQWRIQRASAAFLLAAALVGFYADAVALFAATRPQSGTIEFILVHGCVFGFGALLWRAQPSLGWHRTAIAVHVLLAFTTLLFWPILATSNGRWVGYLALVLHVIFAELQLYAATAAEWPRSVSMYRPSAAITPRRDFVPAPLEGVPARSGSSHRAGLRSPGER